MPQAITLVCLATAVLATVAGLRQWRRRADSCVATPMAMAMFAAAEWAVAQVGVEMLPWESAKIVANYSLFAGVAVLVVAALWYAAGLTGQTSWLTRRTMALLCIEPVLLLTAIVTDAGHRLFFAEMGVLDSGTYAVTFGPLFWVHTLYSYTLLAAAMVVLLRAMLHAVAGHRKVYGIALASMMIPLLGNLLTLARPSTGPATDLTPVLFVVTSALWIWIDQHRSELQAVPISTRHVVSALPDAVIVVDGQGHLVDANPAALQLLAAGRRAPGVPQRVVGEHWRDVVGAELAGALEVMGHSMVTTPGGTVLDVRTTPLLAPDASVIGAVVVARDVSELERLRAELAELAVRDALTGLFNRRHLEAAVSEAVRRADDDRHRLSAVMIDIDHFKTYNDRYGHAVGDEVLVSVAHDIATVLGPGVVARFGGEEFVALLPGLDAEQAAERVAGWRFGRSRASVGTSAGDLPVTVSAGVAEHCAGGTAAGLLAAADAALYAAKAAGRDRVVVAAPSATG